MLNDVVDRSLRRRFASNMLLGMAGVCGMDILARAMAETMKDANVGDITPPPMSDAAMLETLAEWLDIHFENQEQADSFAEGMGRADDNEVQMDLRRIAARLRALDERVT